MVDLECPFRRWSVRSLLILIAACSWGGANGEPVSVNPRWEARFDYATGGGSCESTSVTAPDGSFLVTVVMSGANPGSVTLKHGNRGVAASLKGYDPVTRLGFIQAGGDIPLRPAQWLGEVRGTETKAFQALGPNGLVKCHGTGFIGQIGGKVLPLALLQVRFDHEVPPPGTPLMDESGRIAALLFQSAGNGGNAYAVPAEAVHRVNRDIIRHGRLVRGWLGLTLEAQSRDPQVVRVLPGSPAAAAGIRANDVLSQIGTRRITSYPEAVDAFFYLLPGKPVAIKILRGAEPLEFAVTPVIAKPG
jgi:hypothetical protein